MKHGDIVVVSNDGSSREYFACLLSQGPKTFDLVVTGGGTERHRHGARDVRLATIADFNDDPVYMERTSSMLRKDAADARQERRTGARIKRGVLWPSH